MSKMQFCAVRNAQGQARAGLCLGLAEFGAVKFSRDEIEAACEEMKRAGVTASSLKKDGFTLGRTDAGNGENFALVVRDSAGLFVSRLTVSAAGEIEFDGGPFFSAATRSQAGAKLFAMCKKAEIFAEREANAMSLETGMAFLDEAARLLSK